MFRWLLPHDARILVGCMLWICRRRTEDLRVETRALDQQYIMRVFWPDRREQLETFSTDAAFCLRLIEFDSQLCEQNWINPAGPFLTDEPN